MKTTQRIRATLQLLGAMALSAAGAATHAYAAPAQIQFTGSYISSWQGNDLATDFGSEGFQDSIAWGPDMNFYDSSFPSPHACAAWGTVDTRVLGKNLLAHTSAGSTASPSFLDARMSINLSFSDMSIRNEAFTCCNPDLTDHDSYKGVLNLHVNRVHINRVAGGTLSGFKVNNNAYTQYLSSPVPEPSSLSLLTRRRLERAA